MATFGSEPANADFSQMTGTATNDNASAGNIGENIESDIPSISPVSLVTATAKTVTSIALTAGDWDIGGLAILSYSSATQSADGQAAVSNITNSFNGFTDAYMSFNNTRQTTTTSKVALPVQRVRISINAPITYFLVAQATFSAGSCSAYGFISARRVR